tara:strand:+ start:25 stop:744 length:720 start_codon:yes stop_codon:yes gene_type:complete
MTALTVQVAAADEDGFIRFGEDQSGFMGDETTFTTNSKVFMGRHTGSSLGDSSYDPDTYTGWIHLKNLTIAQGATINNAKLHFYHNANSNFDAEGDPGEGFTVAAQDVDDASKPTQYSHVTGWTLTSATVATGSLIDASEGGMGPNESFNNAWYPTHASAGAGLEIKTVLQELVNRSGWSSGSNINLKLTPATYADIDWDISWTDYDTSTSLAMKLVIDYTEAGAGATATPAAFLLFVD